MIIDIRHKQFGEKKIFENLSLTIKENKISVMMGESGSGKTTLLRLIAGLDKDYIGKIEPLRRATMLFQEDRLVENISVLSNLKLVSDSVALMEKYLQEVALKGEEKSLVSSLSGGMKRRVSIVRFLLVPSSLYLLDEPFTAMDEETVKIVASLIKKVVIGKTVIVVSHNPLCAKYLLAEDVIHL